MTMQDDTISQDHGAGAAPMRELLDEYVLPRFENDGQDDEGLGSMDDGPDDEGLNAMDEGADVVGLGAMDDGAVFPVGDHAVVVTTDSHVVDPLQFPGGDIGRLAVSGTVNDLAMMGATDSVALTNSVVVEDGLDLSLLDDIFASMEATCEEANCSIVAGDTKVMGGGDIDRLVINTTGVGIIPRGQFVTDAGLEPGDRILVSGTVGDHGIALLAAREEIGFGEDLESDVGPVDDLVDVARAAGEVTAMKDPTRGGLSTALNEMAEKAGVGMELRKSDIPVKPEVSGAAEVLGIDPFDVANEGKFVLTVPADDAEAVRDALRAHPHGEDAAIVGDVVADHPSDVVLDTGVGRRFLTEPVSEPLPRIC